MQRFLNALRESAKSYHWLKRLPEDIPLIEQFIQTGDKELKPALLKIDQWHLRVMNPLAVLVARPGDWTDVDRRLVELFALRSPALHSAAGKTIVESGAPGDHLCVLMLGTWLSLESPEEDCFEGWKLELLNQGVSLERIAAFTARCVGPLTKKQRLTSAGRFLLGLPADQLAELLSEIGRNVHRGDFVAVLISQYADRFREIANILIKEAKINALPDWGWQWALRSDPCRFEKECAIAFQCLTDITERFYLGRLLEESFPGKYIEFLWQIVPSMFISSLGTKYQSDVVSWMVSTDKTRALWYIQQHILSGDDSWASKIVVLDQVVNALGSEARSVVLAVLLTGPVEVWASCLQFLVGFREAIDDPIIEASLEAGFKNGDDRNICAFISIAAEWNSSRSVLWIINQLNSRSTIVVQAALQSLKTLGDGALPQVEELLKSPELGLRKAAVKFLAHVNTPEAIHVLCHQLEVETSMEVTELIQAALPVELQERKAPGAVAKTDTKTGIRSSEDADLATVLLQELIAAEVPAGNCTILESVDSQGDDRVVVPLAQQIEIWAKSGRDRLADLGLKALVSQGSDAASYVVYLLMMLGRCRFKKLARAADLGFAKIAEARGCSIGELSDRIFVRFDWDLNCKRMDRFQALWLEQLMVSQHRWSPELWCRLFLDHPLLAQLTDRLIWGVYNTRDQSSSLRETFRLLDRRSFISGEKMTREVAELPELFEGMHIGIVHPLELDGTATRVWQQQLEDAGTVPLFPQLGRIVITPTPKQLPCTILSLSDVRLRGKEFRDRADKRGWFRGSVGEGGIVRTYFKPFSGAGVDVFLEVDDLFLSREVMALGRVPCLRNSVSLHSVYFVRHSKLHVGLDLKDEPTDESDKRLVAIKDVQPIVFSEAMADVWYISGGVNLEKWQRQDLF